jgi:serine/threonine protein kinase
MSERIAEYELLERLGAGGMGTVYHARDTITGEEVAVKILHSHLVEPDYVSRLEREARIAAELDHPNIVRVNEFGVYGGQQYLVMELVEGESLLQRLRREGKLLPEEARRIAADVARALKAASAHGVVHRDIKPGNILIDRTGTVKVTDFGVAKVWGASTITPAAGFLGTVSYAAPEVWEGRADERSDLYSLGIMAYHMVTGHLPFEGDTPYSTLRKHQVERPDLREIRASDRRLSTIVSILLRKKPEQRFQSAAELLDALGGRIRHRVVAPSGRLLAAGLAGVLVPMVLAFGILLSRSGGEHSRYKAVLAESTTSVATSSAGVQATSHVTPLPSLTPLAAETIPPASATPEPLETPLPTTNSQTASVEPDPAIAVDLVGSTATSVAAKVFISNIGAASVALDYGDSTAYGLHQAIPIPTDSNEAWAYFEIAGLECDTTYHFRATILSTTGKTSLSKDVTYTTPIWESRGFNYKYDPTVYGNFDSESVQRGRADLHDCDSSKAGFSFSTGTAVSSDPDIWISRSSYWNFEVVIHARGILDLGRVPLESVTEVPAASGKAYDTSLPLIETHTYALITGDGAHYVLIGDFRYSAVR